MLFRKVEILKGIGLLLFNGVQLTLAVSVKKLGVILNLVLLEKQVNEAAGWRLSLIQQSLKDSPLF